MLANILRAFSGGFERAFESLEFGLYRIFGSMELKTSEFLIKAKGMLLRALLEITLMTASVFLLIAGLMVFFLRFFPLDTILIGTGLMMLIFVLLLRSMK